MAMSSTDYLFAPHFSQVGVTTTHFPLDWLLNAWQTDWLVKRRNGRFKQTGMSSVNSMRFAHYPHHLLHKSKASITSTPEDGACCVCVVHRKYNCWAEIVHLVKAKRLLEFSSTYSAQIECAQEQSNFFIRRTWKYSLILALKMHLKASCRTFCISWSHDHRPREVFLSHTEVGGLLETTVIAAFSTLLPVSVPDDCYLFLAPL